VVSHKWLIDLLDDKLDRHQFQEPHFRNMSDEQITVKIPLSFGEIQSAPFKFLRQLAPGINIFLYGAQGTGKTSFLKALSGGSIEEIRGLGRTTAVDRTKIYYSHSNTERPFHLIIKCSDSPGELPSRIQSFEWISKEPPTVALLFLDHFDTRKKLRQDFSLTPNPSFIQIQNWEMTNKEVIGRADKFRIRENRIAINDLFDGFCRYPSLRKHCCLIVPVFTKYDLWAEFINIDDFYDHYKNELMQFSSNLNVQVTNVMPCSAIINVRNSMYKIMRLISDEAKRNSNLLTRIKNTGHWRKF
jgi:GTPase SAR1 family protein